MSAAPPALAIEATREAGLRYVSDSGPGIRRRQRRGKFEYILPAGGRVTDPATLQRIKLLAVPPAWEDVWICPTSDGHIQATGRDQRGRKQYRYHARWREVRDESKFASLTVFGEALPLIRKRVEADLRRRGLPREKVLATVVRLLDLTAMRVGNEEYARTNGSYGLTTLHDKHAAFAPGTVSFTFNGKSGKKHAIEVHDARLARIVRQCRDLPGYELFQYLDADGQHESIGSAEVNRYIREISCQEFTAKHFRTWDATLLGAVALREFGPASSRAEAARNVNEAVRRAANFLGNTLAICKKSYVHPAVIDGYLEGRTMTGAPGKPRAGLVPEECALLLFLRSEERRGREHVVHRTAERRGSSSRGRRSSVGRGRRSPANRSGLTA
jgi:DNA topoisomerase-1